MFPERKMKKVFFWMAAITTEWKTLKVTEHCPGVYHVLLNRPKKLNSMTDNFFREIRDCFYKIGDDSKCRAVVLSGAGRCFTAGLDLSGSSLTGLFMSKTEGPRKALALRDHVLSLQECFNAVENCPQPVIAAVHGAVVGGGIDLMACCDIRYCASKAFFTIKEIDLGLAADLGTLSRLPKIIGNDSMYRELAYTARRFTPAEALQLGLVSKICFDAESVLADAFKTATTIASKSPMAVFSTKHNILYNRDHSVEDGLRYIATWNGSALQSKDVMESMQAFMAKKQVKYSDLLPRHKL